MSFQAMSWAVRQKVGNSTGKAILLMLANYCDAENQCFPSQKKLAEECECGLRTITRWLSEFEKNGLLERLHRVRPDGSRTSDEIKLLVDGKPTRQSGALDDLHAIVACTTSQSGVPNEPINETITRSDKVDEEFDDMVLAEYPPSPHTLKSEARKAYRGLTKAKRVLCIRGVARFSIRFDEKCKSEADRAKEAQYVMGLHKWIKKAGWEIENVA